MEQAQKNYRRARRVERCAPWVMVLGWALMAALILAGTAHMERFSLFMVLALAVGLGGMLFRLWAALHFGRRANELARCITGLDLSRERMFRRAEELELDPSYLTMLISYSSH